MNNYLADTTVAVEHLRGNKKAKVFLEKYSPNISTVTIAELIQGSRNSRELTTALKLCTGLYEVVIDKKISAKAIELLEEFYLSNGLLFLDALVAATAIENKLTLVTGNLKHFRFIKELEIAPQEIAFSE